MFLLDTDVVSELRKADDGRANEHVVAWISARDPDSMHVSAISLMELEVGVLRIEGRDNIQGRLLRNWLDNRVMSEFEGRILAIDSMVAIRCARLHVPDRKSERDALIAATALVHDMSVVTRNRADFLSTGVHVIDPWETVVH